MIGVNGGQLASALEPPPTTSSTSEGLQPVIPITDEEVDSDVVLKGWGRPFQYLDSHHIVSKPPSRSTESSHELLQEPVMPIEIESTLVAEPFDVTAAIKELFGVKNNDSWSA